VQAAEDGWNNRNPEKVSMAYTQDSQWRNRNEFLNGREEVEKFLTKNWENNRTIG
jgi:nuclear transport factor 2 (NTF2) superfamily protein